MKGYKAWCVCLLAWVIGCCGAALAESRFDALCSENAVNRAETTAWMEIPETHFCMPVMRSAQDDAFYANHDPSGAESQHGALYMQAAYNAADFSDPVTIIYGSSREKGDPFRDLQEMYSGRFGELKDIQLHLPDKTLNYEVFAAVPYSSIHILHYYDFTTARRFTGFFDSVFSLRQLGMHLDKENRPEAGDSVLILSTGLRGDRMQRYLVMAKLAA